MKKKWEEPRIEVQKFIPNEYVAACYKIKCTTPKNNSTYHYLYEDTNSNGMYDADDRLVYSNEWGGFHGCNKWHKGIIQDDAPIANGFVVNKGWGGQVTDSQPVFWWEENLGKDTVDYHVMTPGSENYETNPNAS